MAEAVYVLCALTSMLCSVLLLRAYRRLGMRLLLWSGLCFAGLALNNILVLVDVLVFPDIDLSAVRTLPALGGVAVLLLGLVWEGI